MITSSLRPLSGSISINGRCRIGIFTQHSADKFDLRLSALENLMAQFPDAVDQEMRSFVGRFQIQGDDALKPMMLLSGGQKSRVAFAALAFQKPVSCYAILFIILIVLILLLSSKLCIFST